MTGNNFNISLNSLDTRKALMSSFPAAFLNPFLTALHTTTSVNSTTNDHPNYYKDDPSTLITSAQINDLSISTGASLYSRFEPVLLSAEHSLIIVTCFWARSESLNTLNHVLRTLSSRHDGPADKLRVRICFSSLSVTQKLFHTRALSGQTWPPATWAPKLGLPPPSELTGLDLEVKSIFVLPFSVMHPKFIIVDGRTVLLPSCNVSWEDWCEGCVQLSGDVVGQFVRFYNSFWADAATGPATAAAAAAAATISSTTTTATTTTATPSIFLPSPHHPNPNFTFLPFLPSRPAPATPLNTFLLTAIAHATRSVVITTPNLTSPPLISAILSALRSGVDITIYTSARMMLLEQLLTAGTVTEWCVWRLRRKYRKLLRQQQRQQQQASSRTKTSAITITPSILPRWSRKTTNNMTTTATTTNINNTNTDDPDLEQQIPASSSSQPHPGRLQVFYFSPTPSSSSTVPAPATSDNNNNNNKNNSTTAPSPLPLPLPAAAKLHFKSTIIDGEIVVLGSGNMDRASWYTSQELGVAFASRDLARLVHDQFVRFLTLSGRQELGGAGEPDLECHEEWRRMQVRRVI